MSRFATHPRASSVGCYLEHMLRESHLPRHPEQSRQRTKAGSVGWQNRGPWDQKASHLAQDPAVTILKFLTSEQKGSVFSITLSPMYILQGWESQQFIFMENWYTRGTRGLSLNWLLTGANLKSVTPKDSDILSTWLGGSHAILSFLLNWKAAALVYNPGKQMLS